MIYPTLKLNSEIWTKYDVAIKIPGSHFLNRLMDTSDPGHFGTETLGPKICTRHFIIIVVIIIKGFISTYKKN